MLDKAVALALSVESNPQVFALLLGSGTSQSAEIPTGWDVQIELIRRIATLQKEDVQGDPVSWYKSKFDSEPDYSQLLEMLAPSPVERQGLLQSFFEATTEDREEGRKVPKSAHKAIASLVKQGFLRVIVTTNFDRLLEQALDAEGIVPTVISSADALKGAKPYPHTQCTIVKVHGDYLDTQFRNSQSELAKYEPELEAYLERLFLEHSLVVCGWSASWDPALRGVLLRGNTQRYSTYWTTIGEPSIHAKELIHFRSGQIIQIKDSDSFFSKLGQDVLSARALKRPHPVSVEMARSTLKRLLVDDTKRIELHDLLVNEAERAYKTIIEADSSVEKTPNLKIGVPERAKLYESSTEILQSLFVVGSYWAKFGQTSPWVKAMSRLMRFPELQPGYQVWEHMQRYPALLFLYSTGISAVSSLNFELLKDLLAKVYYQNAREERSPLLERVNAWVIFDRGEGQNFHTGNTNLHTPVSDHLFRVLKPNFNDILLGPDSYESMFDQWEYLQCLLYADMENPGEITEDTTYYVPHGSFIWRLKRRVSYSEAAEDKNFYNQAFRERREEIKKALLAAGFFSGSSKRFEAIRTGVEKTLQEIAKRLW
jgi:hypothetical protein